MKEKVLINGTDAGVYVVAEYFPWGYFRRGNGLHGLRFIKKGALNKRWLSS